MYDKKLEWFKDAYKRNLLISGLSSVAVGYLPIGSPCIGIIDSKSCIKKPQHINTPQFSLEDIAKAIKKGDEAEMRSIMNNQMLSITILFPFNIGADSIDFVKTSLRISCFYYIHKLPLIYDTPYTARWDASYITETSEFFIEDIKELPALIQEQLKSNRFVNYTFFNIKRSNIFNIESNLKAIIKVLSKEYPSKASYHRYRTDNRVLLDTMSISFYNLVDVIPIFDHKKAEGVGIDIMLTNSEVGQDKIMSEGYSLLFRFIFGKYRENIFALDGETIRRPYSQAVGATIDSACELLKNQCPRDKRSSKKAKKEVSVKNGEGGA